MYRIYLGSKRKLYFVIIFFIAISLGIGYAYLSTTLQIGGTTKVLKVATPVSFTTDSWDTIISAVKKGDISNYHVGDTKEVDMGKFGTHILRIANTASPSECETEGFSQTACGFVLEFADIITTHVMNSTDTNVGGWPASEMCDYVNDDIYNALPSEIKSGIIDTFVVSGHGSSDSSNFTSTDKLYLLSAGEVWGTNSNISSFDTAISNSRQLDYYQNLGVTNSNYSGAVKQYGSDDTPWWLRTARAYEMEQSIIFMYVGSNGGMITLGSATSVLGVSPAFRLG